ncbi:methyltransferase [Kitasatospora sp. NPDC094015]|uniref:methyltransferase n=1 Tax=Kitasatospora sp. NPDC094015 TaxID=3155205 RepID=UPI0033273F3E
MHTTTAADTPATELLLTAHDFTSARHVVDVLGGAGALLAAVLAEHPQALGTLFDLPLVIDGAGEPLRAAGVDRRCALIGGDAAEHVPLGADVYLLGRVPQDAEVALRVLRTLRTAMTTPAARLLVLAPTAEVATLTPLLAEAGLHRCELPRRAGELSILVLSSGS